MSIQIIVGIILNIIIFGIMGFRNQKLGISTPIFLQSELFGFPLVVADVISFIIILSSPDSWFVKITTAILMFFVINHVFWGVITGLISGIGEKKKRVDFINKLEEEYKNK